MVKNRLNLIEESVRGGVVGEAENVVKLLVEFMSDVRDDLDLINAKIDKISDREMTSAREAGEIHARLKTVEDCQSTHAEHNRSIRIIAYSGLISGVSAALFGIAVLVVKLISQHPDVLK